MLCWIQHGGEPPWACEIARHLRMRGVETRFVATFREGQREYERNAFSADFISGVAFDTSLQVPQEEIRRLDVTLGPPLVRSIVRSDVHLGLLHGGDEHAKCSVVARAYRFWSDYLERHHVDAFILRETQSFATRTAYVLARSMGIPVLRLDIGPTDDWFTLRDVNEEALSSELLQQVEAGPKPLSKDMRRQVEDLVADRVTVPPGEAKLRDCGHPLWRLGPALVRERLREARVDLRQDPLQVAAHRLRRRVMRQRAVARKVRRVFPYDDVSDTPYVYLPLYFRDEGMTLALYHFWAEHQHALVKELSEVLPEGYELWVKEHPHVPGDQRLSDLWRLKRTRRVKVIDPRVHSRVLQRNAAAVVVLQGTAGWESFLFRRPVVVVSADLYYAQSRLVYRLKDICDAEDVLTEAIMAGGRRYEENEDEWAWFVSAVLGSALPGDFLHYDFPYFSDTNLKLVAEGIADKVRAVTARTS